MFSIVVCLAFVMFSKVESFCDCETSCIFFLCIVVHEMYTKCVRFCPSLPNGLSYLYQWTNPCLMESMSDWFVLLLLIIDISVLKVNSVAPDQTPRSDISLHYLSAPPLRDAIA